MSLEMMFNPKSIACVGASPKMIGVGKLPYYQMLKISGYRGRLYAVNPSYTEIEGDKVYPSLDDLPESVDLVIVSAPAKAALETMKSAARSGARFIHFFTSGFSEVGNKGLEAEVLAARGNTRILGPNCIGIHCSESKVSFEPFYKQNGVGQAAFLGQSGGITINFMWMCQSRQIPINKVVSYGNQMDITVEDMIEYLGNDATVKVIGAYVEDIKHGGRFVDVLRDASSKKPVVILKGGRTSGGAKAAASHTGAMAGSQEIWSSVMKQCKCIEAETFEQLVDVVMLATSCNVPKGSRVGFLAAGGGTSVLFTDLAYINGMKLPQLERGTQEAIASRIKNVNTFTENPVDLGAYGFDFNIMAHTMKMMDQDPNVDILVPYFSIDFIKTFQSDQIKSGPHTIVEAVKGFKKPVIPILSKFTEDDPEREAVRIQISAIFREAGLPVFNNIQDCIGSLKEMLKWSGQPGSAVTGAKECQK